MRRFIASEWTAAGLTVFVVGLHVWWFEKSAKQAEVLSALGGALTVLGVFVAAQPYIRKGLIETAREQIGLHPPGETQRQMHDEESDAEFEGVRHVVQERVAGVLLISLGSLLNGYGPAIGSWLSLRGS